MSLACLTAIAACSLLGGGERWVPPPGTTWQWQIVGDVRPPFLPVDMYDIDLEDAVDRPRSIAVDLPGRPIVRWKRGRNAGVIGQLHAAGKKVVCYLDSGAYEAYRPDAHLFPRDVLLNSSGWKDERWLDIRRHRWRTFAPIVWARFDLAKQLGCDGVEPDQNNPVGNLTRGQPRITLAQERAWYLEVARQAHARGLSVGMKNGIEPQVTDDATADAFDWNLNEECFYYGDECAPLQKFIARGKAVFQAEYTDDWRRRSRRYRDPRTLRDSRAFCARARARRFSTLVKNRVPDGVFLPC